MVTQTLLRIAKDIDSDEDQPREGLKRARTVAFQTNYPELSSSNGAPTEEECVLILGRLIVWWDIDIKTFRLDVGLNRKVVASSRKRFEFVETKTEQSPSMQPGFLDFLENKQMSGDATEEELSFLRSLIFRKRRPAAIYYYRELQSLRDPLHFPQSHSLRSAARKGASDRF